MTEAIVKARLTEAVAREIAEWKYPGPYSMYDLPDWDEMQRRGLSLTDPEKRRSNYLAFYRMKECVGFTTLIEEGHRVFVGVGVKPSFCSRGVGHRILRMTVEEGEGRYPGKLLYLEVRTWNERAIRCYQSVGFRVVAEKQQETYLGVGDFFVMEMTS